MKTSSSAYDAADLLHSLAIALLRRVRVEDDATGLGGARLSALSVLIYGGPQTLGELAAAERVSLPTMTRIAAALVRLGYARRAPDENDRRFIIHEATERGAQLLRAGRERRVSALAELLGRLSDGEAELCVRAARVLSATLAESSAPSGAVAVPRSRAAPRS